MLAVVPLAMLGNLLRVVVTVLAAHGWVAAAATHGPLHDLTGVLSFAVSCGLLVGWGSFLARDRRHPEPSPAAAG